jgi:hypothetical protein
MQTDQWTIGQVMSQKVPAVASVRECTQRMCVIKKGAAPDNGHVTGMPA